MVVILADKVSNSFIVKEAKKLTYDSASNSSIKSFLIKIDKLEGSSQKAAALRYLGEVYEQKGEAQKALKFFFQSVNLAKKFGDFETGGLCLLEVASIYSSIDKRNKSTKYFIQSLKYLKKENSRKNSFAIESCYYRLIPDLLIENKPKIAKKYLDMAIRNSVFGAKYLCDTFRKFGYFYFNREDYINSLKYFKLALQLSANNVWNKGEVLSYLGWSLYYLRQFQKAKECILAASAYLRYNKETRVSNIKYLNKINTYLS